MYVLQIKPKCEESVTNNLIADGFNAMCPTEELYIRTGGKWYKKIKVVFSQYVFISCDEITDKIYYKVKSIDGVMRFLGHGKPEALKSDEESYIRWLHNGGKPIEASKIYVTTAGDKMIMSGILRTYKDDIINIDMHSRKAKIHIPFGGKYHKITLPIIGI